MSLKEDIEKFEALKQLCYDASLSCGDADFIKNSGKFELYQRIVTCLKKVEKLNNA